MVTILTDRLFQLMDRISKRTHAQPGEDAKEHKVGKESPHGTFSNRKVPVTQTVFQNRICVGRADYLGWQISALDFFVQVVSVVHLTIFNK